MNDISILKSAFVSSPVLFYEKTALQTHFQGLYGGFEVGEAIRRLTDCVPTGKLNINADEQYALAA